MSYSAHPLKPAVNCSNPQAYAKGWVSPTSAMPSERIPGQRRQLDAFSAADLALVMQTYAWSPITWADGHRAKGSFLLANWIVLDIDEGMSMATALAEVAGLNHVLGTTKSHQKEKNGHVCDRFRVALCCDQFIDDYRDYERLVKHYCDAFGADRACCDAGRFFWPCASIVSVYSEGAMVHVAGRLAEMKSQEADAKSKIAKAPMGSSPRPKGPNKLIERVEQFRQTGAFQEGRRNTSIYCHAKDLAKLGVPLSEAIAENSRLTNIGQREIEATTRSAYKN